MPLTSPLPLSLFDLVRDAKSEGKIELLGSPRFGPSISPMVKSMLDPRKVYSMSSGWAASFATLSDGKINHDVQNLSLPVAVSDFPSLAFLFDEFFITSMTVRYEPFSRYINLVASTG